MSKAQMKAVETEAVIASMEAVEEIGDSVKLSATFQARQAVRVKLHNGIEAIRLATVNAGDAIEAVEETANAPIILAAESLAKGDIGKDELSEALCGAFGRGPATKAGKESKTPVGYGLTFRKRAVCLSQAIGIAYGEIKEEDYPKWSEGKDKAFITETVESLLAGDTSASVAYRDLTEKERAPQPPLAFNPEKLAKLAGEIAKPENKARITESTALMAAYKAMALAIEGLSA